MQAAKIGALLQNESRANTNREKQARILNLDSMLWNLHFLKLQSVKLFVSNLSTHLRVQDYLSAASNKRFELLPVSASTSFDLDKFARNEIVAMHTFSIKLSTRLRFDTKEELLEMSENVK